MAPKIQVVMRNSDSRKPTKEAWVVVTQLPRATDVVCVTEHMHIAFRHLFQTRESHGDAYIRAYTHFEAHTNMHPHRPNSLTDTFIHTHTHSHTHSHTHTHTHTHARSSALTLVYSFVGRKTQIIFTQIAFWRVAVCAPIGGAPTQWDFLTCFRALASQRRRSAACEIFMFLLNVCSHAVDKS